MNQFGILATLEARPGKESDVERFLQSASPLVEAETGTTTWFAFKIAPAAFGIFDTFQNEEGRNAHVSGAAFAGGPRDSRRQGDEKMSQRTVAMSVLSPEKHELKSALTPLTPQAPLPSSNAFSATGY